MGSSGFERVFRCKLKTEQYGLIEAGWDVISDGKHICQITMLYNNNIYTAKLGEGEVIALSGNLGIDVETYWDQLKDIFREGVDERISFELVESDQILSWSKLLEQDISILHGQIAMSPVTNAKEMTGICMRFLERNIRLSTAYEQIVEQKKELEKDRERMENGMKEMIKLKEEMENDLYVKFSAVLNKESHKPEVKDEFDIP